MPNILSQLGRGGLAVGTFGLSELLGGGKGSFGALSGAGRPPRFDESALTDRLDFLQGPGRQSEIQRLIASTTPGLSTLTSLQRLRGLSGGAAGAIGREQHEALQQRGQAFAANTLFRQDDAINRLLAILQQSRNTETLARSGRSDDFINSVLSGLLGAGGTAIGAAAGG